MYAQMDCHKKDEILNRRREAYHNKTKSLTGKSCITPKKQSLMSLYLSLLVKYHVIPSEQIEATRKKDRTRYTNMTPKQKQSKKSRRMARHNALNPKSIAMENPLYIPEPVWDNVDTSGPRGSIPTSDWFVPEVTGTLVYMQSNSEQMADAKTPDMDVSKISRRKHVTPRQRHALLHHHNEAFHARSMNNSTGMTDESLTMNMESHDNGNDNVHTFIVMLSYQSYVMIIFCISYLQEVPLQLSRLPK